MKQHADNAQHAFSSDIAATLHLALPALEALHKAWTTQLACDKYQDFLPALQAGLTKVEEYYDQTSDSDTYTFAMHCMTLLVIPSYRSSQLIIVVLDPSQKVEHIQKYWGVDKLESILEHAEQKVRLSFYVTYQGYSLTPLSTRSTTLQCMATTLLPQQRNGKI